MNSLSPTPDQPFTIGNGMLQPDPAIIATGGVSADVYWREPRFVLEREQIFRRCWLYAGREEELEGAGAFFVRDVEVCGVSVLVVEEKTA